MADEDKKTFDAAALEDDKFYQVQLARSTKLFDTPLAAANSVRLSGSSVKLIADDVFSATEIQEDEKHDIMRPMEQGVIQVSGA